MAEKFTVEILQGEGEIFIGIIQANKKGEITYDTNQYVGEDGNSWSFSTLGYRYHNEISFEYGQTVGQNF